MKYKYKKCQLTTNQVQDVNVHKSHPYCRVPSQPKIWILFLQYQYEFTISLYEFCVHIAWYYVTHFHYYHLLFCIDDRTNCFILWFYRWKNIIRWTIVHLNYLCSYQRLSCSTGLYRTIVGNLDEMFPHFYPRVLVMLITSWADEKWRVWIMELPPVSHILHAFSIVTLITRSHKTGISRFILSAFKASSSEEGTCTSKESIWKITAT